MVFERYFQKVQANLAAIRRILILISKNNCLLLVPSHIAIRENRKADMIAMESLKITFQI